MKSKTLVIGAAALSVWTGAAEEKVLDWSKAQFLSVAAARDKAKGEPNVATFRSVFVNPKEVSRAVWHTTGLGVYEAYVNGTEVGGRTLRVNESRPRTDRPPRRPRPPAGSAW